MRLKYFSRFATAVIIPLIIVAADYASKSFMITYLKSKPSMSVKLTSFFSFVYTWNHGISFGFFNEYYQYSNTIFLILNSLIVLYLFVIFVVDNSWKWPCLLIIGGGIGNLVDRFSKGAVFDFIHLHYGKYSFPAFNIADSTITIGITLLLLFAIFKK